MPKYHYLVKINRYLKIIRDIINVISEILVPVRG